MGGEGAQTVVQLATGLQHLAGVPVQGLWPRVPGVTQGELDRWAELADSENLAGDLMKSINRATTDTFEPEAS